MRCPFPFTEPVKGPGRPVVPCGVSSRLRGCVQVGHSAGWLQTPRSGAGPVCPAACTGFVPVTMRTPLCLIFLVLRCREAATQSNLQMCLILGGFSLWDLKDCLVPVTWSSLLSAHRGANDRKWLLPQLFTAHQGCSHQLAVQDAFGKPTGL